MDFLYAKKIKKTLKNSAKNLVYKGLLFATNANYIKYYTIFIKKMQYLL